jgi:hypothetical protein
MAPREVVGRSAKPVQAVPQAVFADEFTIWPQGFDPAEANVIIGANRI